MKTEYITKPKTEIRMMQILIAILIIFNLITCFKGLGQAAKYDALVKEKEHLEILTETQSSMIADLEENNRRLHELNRGE